MTFEEAIERFLYMETYCVEYSEECDSECSRIVVDAIEKQIPKKPTLGKWSKQLEDKYGDKYYECPCCGDDWNVNEYGSAMQYCWTCGQRIDWGGVE